MAIAPSHGRIDLPAGATMVLLCAIWGLQQVGVKLAVADGLSPALQAGLRSAGAGMLLVGWVWLRGGRAGLARLVAPDGTLPLGLLIGALFAAEFLLLYHGLARTSASRGVLFLYTAPFFVALGAHRFVPGERLGGRQVLGLLCAFGGVMLALGDGLRRGSGSSLAGEAMVLGTAAIWGGLTVLVKASPRLQAIPPAKVLLYQLAGSAPLLLGAAWALGEAGGRIGAIAWISLGYQTVVVAFASYLAWYWLISRYPAGRLSAFSFLTPIFGMAAGVVVLGEPASGGLLLALICVAAGLVLVNGPARAPAPRARVRTASG